MAASVLTPPRRRRPAGNNLSQSVAGLTAALQRALFSEEYARLPGVLQHADPRAKIVAAAVLLMSVGLAHHLLTIAAIYVAVLSAAMLSRLSLGYFLKRVWIGIPLFAALIVFPALFTTPGRPLLGVLDAGPLSLTLTDNGLAGATLFLARVGTSVSVALLLVLTTRWADLLKGLRVLHVPETFVIVLGMTYRYLFLLLYLASNLFLARQSRTVAAASGAAQRRWAAAASGVLFGKSLKMSVEVHQAMVARGFAGEFRTVSNFAMRDPDWLLVATSVVVAAGLLLAERGA